MKRRKRSRSVLITGCSTGIGHAAAVRLSKAGWRVFAGVRTERDAETLASQTPASCEPIQLDVTDADAIAAASARVAEVVGEDGLDGLINNAGLCVASPVECLGVDALRHQLEVNTIGPIALTRATLPLLMRARGRVVMVSSISGRIPFPIVGAYTASKHALECLSHALRVEIAPCGVRVTVIEPGPVRTPIWSRTSKATADAMKQWAEPQRDRYGSAMDRMRQVAAEGEAQGVPPEDVAALIEQSLLSKRPMRRKVIGASFSDRVLLTGLVPGWARDRAFARGLGLG